MWLPIFTSASSISLGLTNFVRKYVNQTLNRKNRLKIDTHLGNRAKGKAYAKQNKGSHFLPAYTKSLYYFQVLT